MGPVAETFHERVAGLEARVRAEPADVSSLRALARTLHDAHRESEAVLHYEKLLALDPIERETHLDLAACYAALGRWNDVESIMSGLLDVSRDDPAAHYNLGAARANLGDPAGARHWWRKAAEQGEDDLIARKARESLERLD